MRPFWGMFQTGWNPTTNEQEVTAAIGDSANLDAFARLRVSNPATQFDYSNQYAPSTFANQQFFDVSTTGAGSVTENANQCSVTLSTGGVTSGDQATIQTKQAFIYQPGKSRLAVMSFVFGAATSNTTIELGYASANNGILLQRISDATTTTNYITRRTFVSGSAVDNRVAQSDWNIDKFDGSGPSRIVLDLTKTQILIMDLQFLGVGRVRVGFDVNGKIYYAHQFLNANSLTTAYMSTGSLPLRFKVSNTATSGGAAALTMICASVMVEGGYDGERNAQFSASNGVTPITTGTTFLPLITIRPKTTFNGLNFRGHVVPIDAALLVTGQIHEWMVFRNATILKGGLAPTWVSADSVYSAAEYCVDADSISGGIPIFGDYIPAGGVGAGSYSNMDNGALFQDNPLVYTSLNNVQETLTIAARTVTGAGTAFGKWSWQERY